jgi:hypothetical protein
MAVWAVIWGGTQITTTRVVLAAVAEVLIIVYLAAALKMFGR